VERYRLREPMVRILQVVGQYRGAAGILGKQLVQLA
jgi:hypothetical protein